MTGVHVALGIAVIALNLAAGAWGAWRWWRVEPSPAFWGLLRTAQIVTGAQVLVGGVLLALDREAASELHYLYGALPILVSFMAEQLRIGAAEAVLGVRGHADADAVGRLPDDQQRSVVLAIVRREMGVMALSALVVFGLALRAAFVSPSF